MRDIQKNGLLAMLPESELQRWAPQFEIEEMPTGKVLFASDEKFNSIYFPVTAVVSLLYRRDDATSAEVAIVGREGVVGISLVYGGITTANLALVQTAGLSLRLRDQAVKEGFLHAAPVFHLMLRYTQALITQMSQTSVCKQHHTKDQQFYRWLLLSLDRLQSLDIAMSPDIVGPILALTQADFLAAVLKLQRAGLIRYENDCITVLNRQMLESRTCECYALVKSEYEHLSKLSGIPWAEKNKC